MGEKGKNASVDSAQSIPPTTSRRCLWARNAQKTVWSRHVSLSPPQIAQEAAKTTLITLSIHPHHAANSPRRRPHNYNTEPNCAS